MHICYPLVTIVECTMGWDMSYNIYGLFSLNDGRNFVLPLKNFHNKNDAINYIKV